MRFRTTPAVLVCAFALTATAVSAAAALDAPLATQSNPMTIVLDERTAPRGFAYSHLTIPVRSGPFTLDYPQWIPGEHGPTGPLNDLSELRISAGGQPISWHRDPVDMYAFHVDVPPGVTRVNVDFTVLLNRPNTALDGQLANATTMAGNWNRYLLYQRNIDNQKYYVRAALILPEKWDYANSLPVASRQGNRIQFKTVTLETLVDSPTDSGRYYKHITSWSGQGTHTYIDVFADSPEDFEFTPSELKAYKRMTPEAMALYGGRHWNLYHSELILSDVIPNAGIEHHQSSDDRAAETFITDPNWQLTLGDLLTHEFSHSWNGKYRRPFDLQQPNFNAPYPERTELLWQYEGMNQYMGDLIAFRCGIKGRGTDYRDYFASIYSQMAYEPGRKTTSIIDLTTGGPYYLFAGGDYGTLRRGFGDFYTEGELMWVDADTIIRQRTHNEKSLDDYVKVLAGGTSAPRVVTYTRADLERYLNEVVPYDWHGFFDKYVYSIAPQPPTDEIRRAGYRLVFNATPNKYIGAAETLFKFLNAWYDLGIQVGGDGTIGDVRENSPAWNAGLGVNMKIAAVNDREFSTEVLRDAIAATASNPRPIDLLVNHAGYYEEYIVHYGGGKRYPHLLRIPGTFDMFADMMRPHAK
ncbi:MAG TPA: hypothetical protein VGZ02_11750 [Candidatus Baltobacteraceae bacterium]|nr:hypothetical protein [Candidatus Baltobacteraceae bacterium]